MKILKFKVLAETFYPYVISNFGTEAFKISVDSSSFTWWSSFIQTKSQKIID